MSETITDTMQQNASRVAKAMNRPLTSRISSPTRALMKNRREMLGNTDDKHGIECVEICKTIKKKAREDIRKYNQDIKR